MSHRWFNLPVKKQSCSFPLNQRKGGEQDEVRHHGGHVASSEHLKGRLISEPLGRGPAQTSSGATASLLSAETRCTALVVYIEMRPRLRRTIEQIDVPDGDIVLMRSSTDDVRIPSPGRTERELLAALDGSHELSVLQARFGKASVSDVLSQMQDLGLLEDAEEEDRLAPQLLARFDRQLRYFGDLAQTGGVTPTDCQERLRDARVAVLGVGGLGGRIALDLASCGVGEMWLVDEDRVELSNLNRQVQYVEADIGSLKVEAAAARIHAFNSDVRVQAVARRITSAADIAECIEGADLVIDAADWPPHEIEYWCNDACFAAGVPYIAMGHFPPIARVGPLYVPGQTGCFACQDAQYRREYPLYDVAIAQRRAKPSEAATFGPACGLIAGLVSADAIHRLTGVSSPATLGTGYIFDLRTFGIETYEVPARQDCPVCSRPPVRATA